MQLFYIPDINGNIISLTEDEARHATQVLRKRLGDTLQITDGKGSFYTANIIDIGKKNCTLSIVGESTELQKSLESAVHIAIAPTKNIDRLEWFLEKSTEIGIGAITPIFCKRSERTQVKMERLRGIVISAMKQSLKSHLPILNESIDFQKFIKQDFNVAQKFIAYCNDTETPPLSIAYQKGKSCVILIGPEGDFTPEEVALAKSLGFKGISLGSSRLRTETAGIVAAHTCRLIDETV